MKAGRSAQARPADFACARGGLSSMLTILFDGVAYGMLLFVLAVGLSVTLGLMNFINLAHGAFAMAGGYVGVVLVNRDGRAVLRGTAARLRRDRADRRRRSSALLYVHVYAKSHLDQVLFTIGLVFMAVAAVDYFLGSPQQFIDLPASCASASRSSAPASAPTGSSSSCVCGRLAVGAPARPVADALRRPAARRRRQPRVARGLGIKVGLVFARDLRRRLRAGRPRRRARRRVPRPRSELSAEIHGLLPDRRDRRRHQLAHRPVRRRAPPRRRRRRGQILRARRSAPSSSTRVMVAMLIWRPHGLFAPAGAR